MLTEFLKTGALWRHRGTKVEVVLHALGDGTYRLTPRPLVTTSFENGYQELEHCDSFNAFSGSWTAEELFCKFDPVDLCPNRYYHILEGTVVPDDDP